MSEVSSIQQKLTEILTTQKFTDLKVYQDPKIWSKMTKDERELLGKLLILHAKDKLKKGDKTAFKTFTMATKAAPRNANVFFQKGLAFCSQRNPRHLLSACRAFEKATRLEANFVDAWSNWAYTLLSLGEINADVDILLDALKKFEITETLLSTRKKKRRASLYWNWGHCWHALGKLSGEAVDISNALAKYKKAEALGLDLTDFWVDYGNAFAEQATLLGKNELFLEVVRMFDKAVQKDPNDFEGWFSIGCSYMRLYESNFYEEYYNLADNAFEKASEIYTKSSTVWLCWGQLMQTAAKVTHDMDKMVDSIIRFIEADQCEPNHPIILCRLAESLMNLGAYEESYQDLAEAEEKILRSIQLCPENPEFWYFYARCLVEKGRYFADKEFYVKAIENYEHGYSLNPTLKLFHYGIALAYFELYGLTENEESLSQSLKHYNFLDDEENELPAHFWLDWGNALSKYGEKTHDKQYIESALKKYEKAINLMGNEFERHPIMLETLFQYSISLDLLGDMYNEPAFYEKAIQLLNCLLNFQPQFPCARYQLALIYSHHGELLSDVESFEKSNEQFQIVLDENPEDESAWNDWAITLLNLANLISDPGKEDYVHHLYAIAETKLNHALSLGNLSSYYNMAGYFSLINNFQGALDCLEKAYYLQALPSIEEIMNDDWLIELRQTDQFRDFFSRLISNKID